MPRQLYILLLCAALLPAAAMAQARNLPIPLDAKRGNLSSLQGSIAVLDGQQVQLAAGAQIRGQNNLIILPSNVPPDLVVKYVLDARGQLHRVWILTQQEIDTPDPKPQ